MTNIKLSFFDGINCPKYIVCVIAIVISYTKNLKLLFFDGKKL